jgi:aconitase A
MSLQVLEAQTGENPVATVLILHGLGADGRDFLPVAEQLDLSSVVPSLAGPKRPQDRVPLTQVASNFRDGLEPGFGKAGAEEQDRKVAVKGTKYSIGHGDVVIAAITSCTNTSNPSVMLGAGLVRAMPWPLA